MNNNKKTTMVSALDCAIFLIGATYGIMFMDILLTLFTQTK